MAPVAITLWLPLVIIISRGPGVAFAATFTINIVIGLDADPTNGPTPNTVIPVPLKLIEAESVGMPVVPKAPTTKFESP